MCLVHSWLYFFISVFLKLSNCVGWNDENLCFTSFKTLLWLTLRRKIMLCRGGHSSRFPVFGEATQHWTRHATGFTSSSPACKPVVIQFFSQHLPTIQLSPTFSRAMATRHILCFYSSKVTCIPLPACREVQCGSSVVEQRCCDTVMVMWNSNPTASIWKTSREPNWSLCEWCFYLCLLCQKSRGNT